MLLDELQELVRKHREQAFVTCDDGCFCWDAQNFILEQTAQRSQTLRGANAPKQDWGILTEELAQAVNSLAWIVIDSHSKRYVSGNDLDFANDLLDQVQKLLPQS